MTRRDLEESILNLEYLLTMNGADARKREEREQLLEAFRIVLRAANQQQAILTATRIRKLDADTKIAFMYAEQELFLAAQALISREPLGVAQRHIRHLLEHQLIVDSEIGACLLSLNTSYSRRQHTGLTDAAGADALTTATIAVLDSIRDELGDRIATLAA